MILYTLQKLSKVHQCKICYKPLLNYVKHCHTPSCILWKSPSKYTYVLQDSIQYTCPTNTVLAKTKSTSWRPCPPKPPGQYHETLSHLWYSSAHADLWYSSTYADLPRKMITKHVFGADSSPNHCNSRGPLCIVVRLWVACTTFSIQNRSTSSWMKDIKVSILAT